MFIFYVFRFPNVDLNISMNKTHILITFKVNSTYFWNCHLNINTIANGGNDASTAGWRSITLRRQIKPLTYFLNSFLKQF